MVIGVPKEIKTLENRVALTPGGVTSLVRRGHKVLVQQGAGVGSGLSDAEYQKAGAEIVSAKKPGPPIWWSRSRSPLPRSTSTCARV